MEEELHVDTSASREEKYRTITPQIKTLISGETDLIANMANIGAALKEALGFFWVGFYVVKNNEFVLGPFQGPIACSRIQMGKGVSGAACESGKPLIVPNVDEFPGHIACSAHTKSEIVVPIFRNDTLFGVLDVDSDRINDFNEVDAKWLQEIAMLF
ncbi:MAG: GAF domain-containing protein [Cytophagales bacterium]|nr:GAF domain-containing protein [Cytophagales bacterium]